MLQIVKLSSHIYILSTFTQRIALFWCMITKLLIKKNVFRFVSVPVPAWFCFGYY